MIDWWNSLSIAAQVFACIAVPASLVLLIQTLLMLIGIGEDADGEGLSEIFSFGESDTDAESSISIAETDEIKQNPIIKTAKSNVRFLLEIISPHTLEQS